MKKYLALMAVGGLFAAQAHAGVLEDQCLAFVEANEDVEDTGQCACIEANADAAVTEELLGVETPEDRAAVSAEAEAVIESCTA
ncbi:MAG: hypothetical protein AAGC77_07620 [Pseudomonadota bacterium]